MSNPAERELYDEPLNPVDIEQAIRRLANETARAVRIVSDRLGAFREAERIYDAAVAHEYLAWKGPAHEKKFAAELATTELRRDRDLAEVAWRYAERSAASVERQLSAYQTLNRSVAQLYSAAGVMGEGS